MTMMQHRLLGRLHRVFDRAPADALALRVRAPGGLRWQVADDALTVSRPAAPDVVLPLRGMTVADVRAALLAAGCDVVYANPDVLETGALALLEGAGDQDASNGDHLRVYTSFLWGWTDAVGRALALAKVDIGEMLRQLVITQSSGEWTDLWGTYFGVLRDEGQSDADLAQRIIYEPRRPRSNPVAIRANIKKFTGAKVQVREPWREMMVLGVSKLSDRHRLPDRREFCYHTAQLVSDRFEDWDAIMREAEQDRPAGTLFLPPVTIVPPIEVEVNAGTAAAFAGHEVYGWHLKDFDGHIIGFNFRPSASFVRRNPAISVFDNWTGGTDGLADLPAIKPTRTICKGEIVASVQGPLGGLQSRLPGRRRVERGAPMVLSVAGRLSDHRWRLDWEPVEEWVVEQDRFGNAPLVHPGPSALAREETHFGAASLTDVGGTLAISENYALTVPRVFGAGWSRGWDDRVWDSVAYADPVISGPSVTTLTSIALADGNGEEITDQYGNPIFVEVKYDRHNY